MAQLPPLEPLVETHSIEIEQIGDSQFYLNLLHNGERSFTLRSFPSRQEAANYQFALTAFCNAIDAGGNRLTLQQLVSDLCAFMRESKAGPLVYFDAEIAVTRVHQQPDGRYLRIEPDVAELLTEAEIKDWLEENEGQEDDE